MLEIEIPMRLYEMLLTRAAETGLTIEEIVERTVKNFMERNNDHAE